MISPEQRLFWELPRLGLGATADDVVCFFVSPCMVKIMIIMFVVMVILMIIWIVDQLVVYEEISF